MKYKFVVSLAPADGLTLGIVRVSYVYVTITQHIEAEKIRKFSTNFCGLGITSESAGPLYVSLGILKLTDINKYLIARFMYKYCINMVPRLFSSFFLRNYNVSTYDLRSANCFHLPLVSTDFGKNGIRYRGPIVFNKLLLDGIDSTVSEAVFVNQLKRSIKMGIL